MTSLPTITLVTPSFNTSAYIEETIRSVLNQNYKGLEFIVVDGASEDGTEAILERYQSSIQTIIREKDRG